MYPSGSQGLYSCGREVPGLAVRHGPISAEQAQHKAMQVIHDIKTASKPVLDNGASSADAAFLRSPMWRSGACASR